MASQGSLKTIVFAAVPPSLHCGAACRAPPNVRLRLSPGIAVQRFIDSCTMRNGPFGKEGSPVASAYIVAVPCVSKTCQRNLVRPSVMKAQIAGATPPSPSAGSISCRAVAREGSQGSPRESTAVNCSRRALRT
jgi:hypothetical protein